MIAQQNTLWGNAPVVGLVAVSLCAIGRMETRSAAIKVGLLTLVSIAVLLSVLLWLSGRSLSGGKEYTVVFPDVDGLKESAPVHFMGIRVGFVDSVDPRQTDDGYDVTVVFHIEHEDMTDPDEDIPQGSRLTIQQSGLIGEKFLEITPPMPQRCRLTGSVALATGDPVRVDFADGPVNVGTVLGVSKLPTALTSSNPNTAKTKKERFATYRITRPGVTLPIDAACAVSNDTPNQLMFTYPGEPPMAPNASGHFTIEPPMRFKDFLDVQMETAEALRDTNLKISQLLTDDTMKAITQTVANTETLTERATVLVDSANALVVSAKQDVHQLVTTVDRLSVSLSSVSNNVNALIADGTLQDDLKATVGSIRKASHSLETLVGDPALKQTVHLSRDTLDETRAVMQQLRITTEDPQFQQNLQQSMGLLKDSLQELKLILAAVNDASGEDNEDLRQIIIDAKKTIHQLEEFSDKLDGHFVLFRLLF